MKNNVVFLVICVGLVLSSCNDEGRSCADITKKIFPENVQMYIDEVVVKNVVQTRTSIAKPAAQEVSCHDYITSQSSDFYFAAYSDFLYGIDINKDGFVDMAVEMKGNIVKTTIGNISFSVVWECNTVDNNTILSFYEIGEAQTRGYYKHLSWWECVRNLGTNASLSVGSGVASMFQKYAYGYLIATASIVCLDSRLRWEYVENQRVSSQDVNYILATTATTVEKPVLLLDGEVMSELTVFSTTIDQEVMTTLP